MIAKLVKGTGFRGALNYLMRVGKPSGKDQARIIGGNMAGITPRELAAEFGLFRKLRPKLARAVFHASLSSAPTDRPLDDAEWQVVAARFAQELGYAEAPFVVVRHTSTDADHEHIHILASRVDAQGKTITDAHDFRRAETILREIEQDYRLTPVSPSRASLPQEEQQSRRTLMDDKTQKALEEYLDQSVRTAEAKLNALQGHEIMGAECAETLSERQLRELRRFTLSPEYEQSLRAALGNEIKHIHRTPRGLVIYTTDGGRLNDNGDRIVAYKMNPNDAARRSVEIAAAKGWQAIQFEGSPEFVKAAMRYAVQQGIRVVPQDEAQKAMLVEILAEGQGSSGLSAAPLPAPSARPAPSPLPASVPSPPMEPFPAHFGEDIQRKLDTRRRERELQEFRPRKIGGPKGP